MGKIIIKSILIVLALMQTSIFAASDDMPITEAVAEYNKRLAEAYRTSDIKPLDGIAGPADLRKVTLVIDINKQKGVYLDSKLLNLKVEKMERPSKDSAQVWTTENWEYIYRNIKGNSPTGEAKRENYELVYYLGYREGHWWVERVKWKKDHVNEQEK